MKLFFLFAFFSLIGIPGYAMEAESEPAEDAGYSLLFRQDQHQQYMVLAGRYMAREHRGHTRLPVLLQSYPATRQEADVKSQLDVRLDGGGQQLIVCAYSEFMQVPLTADGLTPTKKFMIDIAMERSAAFPIGLDGIQYTAVEERTVVRRACRRRTVQELVRVKRDYEHVHPYATATSYQRLIHGVLRKSTPT